MPEGHLVHRFAREHGSLLGGLSVHVSSPQGRFVEAAQLDGRILRTVDAYGKHLFYVFAADAVVHVHLGQVGRFVTEEPGTIAWSRLRMAAGNAVLHLVAPSRCELVTSERQIEITGRLGPDPLRNDAEPERALERMAASSKPIGSLLLDQSVVAGIGNVLRAEILFLLGVNPNTPAGSLGRPVLRRLWRRTVAVMEAARDRGSIITREPPGDATTRATAEAEGRFVYKQERCGRCGTPVQAWTLAGRTAYACPRCQAA